MDIRQPMRHGRAEAMAEYRSGSDECKCGHTRSVHKTECGVCIGVARPTICRKFDPKPTDTETRAAQDELLKAAKAVLASTLHSDSCGVRCHDECLTVRIMLRAAIAKVEAQK